MIYNSITFICTYCVCIYYILYMWNNNQVLDDVGWHAKVFLGADHQSILTSWIPLWDDHIKYTICFTGDLLVIEHSYWTWLFIVGFPMLKWPFSIAMLDSRMVYGLPWFFSSKCIFLWDCRGETSGILSKGWMRRVAATAYVWPPDGGDFSTDFYGRAACSKTTKPLENWNKDEESSEGSQWEYDVG